MSASKKKQIRREAALTDPTLTEKQKQELKTAKAHKRNVILGVVVGVVLVVLVAALLVWNSGILLRHTTAVEVNGTKLSVADMDYYYQVSVNETYYQQSLYQQMGVTFPNAFDPQTDYKAQYVDPDAEEKQTYHEAFLEAAKTRAAQVIALNAAADAANYTLSEEAQEQLDEARTSLQDQSTQAGFASTGAYLRAVYGRAMTEKIYIKNMELTLRADDYRQSVFDAMGDYSAEELEAYYQEDPTSLDTFTYHYVYFDGSAPSSVDDDGNTVEATDEEKAEALATAKKNAEALLAAVKAGGNTSADVDEAFVTAAAEYTTSGTLRSNTGSNVSSTSYGKWLTNSSRKTGDVELFESGNYFYVVEFLSRALNTSPRIDVRHILITGVADSDGADTTDNTDADTTDNADAADNTDTTPADDSTDTVDSGNRTMAQAQARAKEILDEFLAGEQTAEAFGELAEKYSEDGRNGDDNALSAAGGLYSDVEQGDMVKNFNNWIFDESRKEGDTGIVQTEYGYHVMYFQARKDPSWLESAQSAKKTAEQNEWLEKTYEGYEAVEFSGFSKVHQR